MITALLVSILLVVIYIAIMVTLNFISVRAIETEVEEYLFETDDNNDEVMFYGDDYYETL